MVSKDYIRTYTNKNRERILKLHGNKCSKCDGVYNLEIHHPSYKSYDESTMVVLCTKCHQNLHNMIKGNNHGIKKIVIMLDYHEYVKLYDIKSKESWTWKELILSTIKGDNNGVNQRT